MKKIRVDFQPVGRRIEVDTQTDLLAAAQAAGVQLSSLCGGIGSCDTCKVRLISGELSSPTLEEQAALSEQELRAGFRLACQSLPETDVKVDIPPESLATPQRLQVEGQEVDIELDPVVLAVDVHVEAASLQDLRADELRLAQALQALDLPKPEWSLPVLETLSERLRSQDWRARLALRGSRVVGVLPQGAPLVGVSVDIGTTKLAAYLVDLASGKTLSKVGAMNPQIAYGEDVVSRIAYANQGRQQKETLHARLVATLNQMVTDLCAQASIAMEQVVEMVAVGNTAMHHLFLGLPVRQLGEAPYVPALAGELSLPASSAGLELAPGAYLYMPPNIAGYVGADHVAMLLATGMWQERRNVLALDIGTNTEITLAAGGRLITCSTASGPVFEGAHIHDGMRAAPGAIERVQIKDRQLRLQTIDDQAPVGICGSGILDAVAEMLQAGIIGKTGRLQKDHPWVKRLDGREGMVLVDAGASGHGRHILVDRKDVHEIQLAKGAIRAGTEILLKQAGLNSSELDEIIIAGAFGTYIHVPSAVLVGMFPDIPLERFRQVGNAAGVGAKQMLVSAERRRLAGKLIERIEYVELTTHPDFTPTFMQALYF
ncbi:MAG: ASKHA domain-containing protein [Anaerolineales bacterium]